MIIHYQYYWVWKYLAFAVLAVTLPIAGLVALKIIQKLSSGRCRSKVCLVGKTAIVTGGASGENGWKLKQMITINTCLFNKQA